MFRSGPRLGSISPGLFHTGPGEGPGVRPGQGKHMAGIQACPLPPAAPPPLQTELTLIPSSSTATHTQSTWKKRACHTHMIWQPHTRVNTWNMFNIQTLVKLKPSVWSRLIDRLHCRNTTALSFPRQPDVSLSSIFPKWNKNHSYLYLFYPDQ